MVARLLSMYLGESDGQIQAGSPSHSLNLRFTQYNLRTRKLLLRMELLLFA
jgi:hypothetical protein